MKPVPRAPALRDLLHSVGRQRLVGVLATQAAASASDERYLHWDQLQRRKPPEGFDHQEWWLSIKLARGPFLRTLPLQDASGEPFRYAPVDVVQRMLHEIDQGAAGRIAFPDVLTNPETRDRYIVSSLIEEAITSSQMEGASTTRQVAADMLRTGRRPTDHSERMILNNYEAIRFVRSIRDQPLTPELVLELHRLTTADTLENPAAAGRLQRPGDTRVAVVDRNSGTVLFDPPPAEQLPHRLVTMCRFANGELPTGQFLHPVIRAVMLHFWLAYDHPFEDGNGRTARALFYWSMLRSNYWLFEYVSISSILRGAFARYGRSYLYSESDENDATYFLIYQLEVMLQAIEKLGQYLERKIAQISEIERRFRHQTNLNHRQLALLGHALRHPGAHYTIKSHQRSHNVAYATARSDLLALSAANLLTERRIGAKTLVFHAPDDLGRRLDSGSSARHRRTGARPK